MDDPRPARSSTGPPAGRADAFDRGRFEQLADDLAGLDVVDRRTRLDDQPMGQGGLGEGFDVVRDDVVATEEAGQRLPGAVQRDGPARRRTEVHVRMVPGAVDEPDDVVRQGRVDIDLADGSLHLAQVLDGQDLLEDVERVRSLLLVEDHDLLDRLRVTEPEAEHEAIELGLGQRERALVLDRVLGSDDEERIGHRVGRAVDRRLTLLHAFEERGLGLRGRAVDLVGEDDLAEDRAWPELELLRLLVVDRQSGHVRGQQVRRELDPPEGAAEAPGDGLGEDGLAGARHVLDEQVASTEEGHEGESHLEVLAHDDSFDVGEDLVAGLLDLGHRPLSRSQAPGVVAPGSWWGVAPGDRPNADVDDR